MLDSVQLWLAQSTFKGLRANFYEDLAEALDDKAALVDEIQKHAQRADEQRDVVGPLYKLWLRRMDDRSFAQALAGTVPDMDVMILEAAESAGSLSDGLRFLSLAITKQAEMKAAIMGAVSGFIFLSGLIVALLFLFSFYGIGIIEEVVPPDAWPWVGQLLRDLAQFVTGFGVWIAIGLGIFSIFYVWSLPNWCGRARAKADDYLAIYDIYRKFTGALFRVTFAALMRNNVSMTEALEKLSHRASPWLQWHIRTILMRLDYLSEEPAKAFDTGIFDRRETWRFIDYGARSSFPVAVGKLGMQAMDTVTKSVQDSAKKIHKTLLLITGALLAFIISGTLLTVYEAQTALQRQMQVVNQK